MCLVAFPNIPYRKERNFMENLLRRGIYFWQGNEACAYGAVAAGCRFFAGYPITPSSEIAEHLARLLPLVGGFFIQMEDELASINAIIGASWAGAKSMTATSGPGFSLMQEGLGYAFMTETPCVVVNVQRAGPSTGQATKGAQGDVMQARWGTHGDYAAVVLSPNSVQEFFELTIRAFNLAEKYRTPVIVLADEKIGHMREKITVPPMEEIRVINRKKPGRDDKVFFGMEEVAPMPAVGEGFNVSVTGSTHNEQGIRFTADPKVHRRLVQNLVNKIEKNKHEIIELETYNVEDCSALVVCYGCVSRAVYEAVEVTKQKGVKVGYVRLKTLWPFPTETIRKLAEKAEKIIVPEMNLKQLFYEVERASKGKAEVIAINKIGGGEMITPEEILKELLT